ncbi:methyl-accepting chemotaxis protein [Thiosulfativibrio zosterae]|uniref:Methyl-accepting chemotaxis protein n=1 Tax=Thiosulfativibrio zosterae TaxID=2675053 RepID=A0A6F8PQZ8_9GAMM|nr:methyl-accepting chemotaxis protein [Thiosulfativibrio zosterae]BBP44464.1 hypothetical protein THMIRHAT_22100 [Thiosulfativibrio zosterae]
MSTLSLKQKLILSLLAAGLLPFALISVISLVNSSQALNDSVKQKLEAVRDIKKASIERYFSTLENQLTTVAKNPNTQMALAQFGEGMERFKDDNQFTDRDLADSKAAILGYWQNQFGKQYQEQNNQKLDIDSFFNQLSPQAIMMQAALIAQNPEPLGSKNNLVQMPGSSLYAQSYNQYHAWFNEFLQKFGLYDIFLVNNDGKVVYTVFKELDFATSLTSGPWKNTGLAEAYRKALRLDDGQAYFTDMALYTPSYDAPAGFASTPIFEKGQRVGTLIFQMPLDTITQVMSQRSGMGETGESYLIGSDKLMRSDSYLDPENHTVVASFRNPQKGMVDTQAAQAVLAGKTGLDEIIDYNGNPVVSAYTPIMLGGNSWGLLVEIDVAEAFASSHQMQMLVLIIGLLGAIIIGLAAYAFALRMAKPIIALADKMTQVGRSFNFKERVEVVSQDEIGKASESLNVMLSSIDVALTEVNHSIGAVAQGNFSVKITSDMQGDLAELKNSVNASADNIQIVMTEILGAMESLAQGRFDVEVNTRAPGEYGVILKNAKQALTALNDVVEDINKSMHFLQQGDFNSRVEADALGALATMKDNFNDAMDSLGYAIGAISQVVAAQAAGDLTMELPAGTFKGQMHDLKNAINYSSVKVKEVVNIAIDTSDVVSGASAEVSQGSGDLSQRVQEQAAALEQTSATMDEMSSQVASNSENAQQASSMAEDVKNKTHNGVSLMQQTITAMSAIEDSSNRITDIVNLIDGIAFQTNLLALNAAVEAARAGEHGRGFAVVAGEVRNLAQKSADAAKDIKLLISQTAERIAQGSVLASQSGEMLSEINTMTDQVSLMIMQIAKASAEQAEGVRQVHQAISQIDSVTQQNAALVEETSAAAESLNHEAHTLKQTMSYFKTGQAHTAHYERPKPSKKVQASKAPASAKPLPSPAAASAAKKPEKAPALAAPKPAKPVQNNSDEWSDF